MDPQQNKQWPQRIEQYIKYYQELLEEKGYLAIGRDGVPRPEPMRNAVRAAIESAIENCNGRTADISFGANLTVGKDGETETSVFTFHLTYDPQKVTIDLKQLSLRGERHQMVLVPEYNSDFPNILQLMKLYEASLKIAAPIVRQEKRKPRRGRGL